MLIGDDIYNKEESIRVYYLPDKFLLDDLE